MNVADYLRQRAQEIHWYRSNMDVAVACGRAVGATNSVEHTASGFTRLADGQAGYCATCVARARLLSILPEQTTNGARA